MEKLYSHYSKGKRNSKKRLYTHLKNVAEKSKDKIERKELDLNLINQSQLAEISFLIGIAHDFGKATSYFQNYLIDGINHQYSHHGLISAFFGYLLIEEFCGEEIISLISYMVIKKHHGNIESPLEDIEMMFYDIKKQLANIKLNSVHLLEGIYKNLLEGFEIDFLNIIDRLEDIVEEEPIDIIDDKFDDILYDMELDADDSVELFLLTQLLYSVLIDSDKRDAARVDNSYFEGAIEERVSVSNFLDKCLEKNPEKFDPNKGINKKRNEFLYDVLNCSEVKKDNYLYSLTAPTGIGKTFASFAIANQIKNFFKKGRRIIYCLPYTSIIDQNYKIFEEIIDFNLGKKYRNNPTKYLLRHHYLTPMRLKKNVELNKDSEETKNLDKYMEDKLLLESWESANIVTTFVQIFESIIGNRNSSLKKFHNIINSIIILDEVQNIPPKYYRVVGKVLKVMAKRFKTHILLLTATQPEIIKGEDVISLVNEKKYATDDIFDRVNLEIVDNLRVKSVEEFKKYFYDNFSASNGLIVCNTISSALSLFNSINDLYSDYKVFSLTTYLTPVDRNKRINEIKKNIENGNKVIVISTQLIEAGVDLSFKEVYRDFGPLDSIIQVAGRCNRNGELAPKKGIVKIVKLKKDDESNPYCQRVYDSILIQFCEEILKEKARFTATEFINLSKEYFTKIRKRIRRDSDQIFNAICELNYSRKMNSQIPIKDFKLIEYQAGKEDIIICNIYEDDNGNLINVEEKINKLIQLYETLKEVENNKKRVNSIIGEIEISKKFLAQYRISVYTDQLTEYKEHHIIKEFRFIKYVRYEDQNKYLYDDNIGFLEKPKKEFNSSFFV